MIVKNPCQNCQNRYVGCHGSCIKEAEYKSWKSAENMKIKEAKTKEYSISGYFINEALKRRRRAQ